MPRASASSFMTIARASPASFARAMRYWIGKLKTRRLTRKDPLVLPEPERRLPAIWTTERGREEFSLGDRVVIWRSSRLSRAVGLAAVSAVSSGPDGRGAEVGLTTVEPLWHTIPTGDDADELPSYALFGRPVEGELAPLEPEEVRLLFRHLVHSNGRLGEVRWFDETEESADVGDQDFDPATIADARRATLGVVVQRQGQTDFRAALLEAYGRRCCISRCDVVPLLEAAHIVPFLGAATNHVQNGLLLRADLHALFDLGLLAINPSTLRVRIHESITQSEYSRFDGIRIEVPAELVARPSERALRHRQQMFPPQTVAAL